MLVLNHMPLSSSDKVYNLLFPSYSGLTRVSKEGCLVWILGTSPRMTFKVCLRMAENRGFRSDLNFSKKWRKPRVEALKCSEIECLGFTERERETFAKLIFH